MWLYWSQMWVNLATLLIHNNNNSIPFCNLSHKILNRHYILTNECSYRDSLPWAQEYSVYFVKPRIHNLGVRVVAKCSIWGWYGSTGSRMLKQMFGRNVNPFFTTKLFYYSIKQHTLVGVSISFSVWLTQSYLKLVSVSDIEKKF